MGDEVMREVSGWIRNRIPDASLAEKQISRFCTLYELLKEGIVHFWFKKTDGSLRSAYGTLDMSIVRRHDGVPQGNERNERAFSGTVSYYDLEKDAWRCFKADSIQEIDFGYGIE